MNSSVIYVTIGKNIYWRSIYHSGNGYSTNPKALGRWYRLVGWGIGDVGGEGKSFDVSSNGIKTKSSISGDSILNIRLKDGKKNIE